MIDAIRGRPGTSGKVDAARDDPVAPAPPTARRTPTTTRDAPSDADDAHLVAAAKRDLAAFAPLYDRYLGPVYRFCLARLGDVETAEDATALVFTKALAALAACRDGHFRPWLFAIARNVVADEGRAARPLDPLDAAAELADPAPSPDDLALRADDIRGVRALLTNLTPEQRDVVELRLAGLTGPEIARSLGRSHASVRVAQFRAYARLRAILAPDRADRPHPEHPPAQPSPSNEEPPR